MKMKRCINGKVSIVALSKHEISNYEVSDRICYKLRRKTHTLACGMKAAFSVQNYISTT